MSIKYTPSVASFVTKRESRKKVANGIKDTMKNNSVIHYLGGTSTQTPFENQFKNRDCTFVRYERMRSIVPSGYKQVTFDEWGEEAFLPKGKIEKGYFVNDDFFNSFFYVDEKVNKKVKGNETHFWLDFCGMPTNDLLECLYWTFLEESAPQNFKSIYLTFFMNPRNCKDMKGMFTGNEKTLEERANTMLEKIKQTWQWEYHNDKTIEVFDTYHNGKSPMCVLKIERREQIEDMSQKASVQNYVNLHKRGFTNKQIAIFWRAGIMQVAGFAASAKRQKMI
jgi:hypothetical protein